MKGLDRIIRWFRVREAIPHVHRGDRLLDVGCWDGYLIRHLRGTIGDAVGVDSAPEASPPRGAFQFVCGSFPKVPGLDDGRFDCVTMLAVLEHVPDPQAVAAECYRVLSPRGRVVLSVPSAAVDTILGVLQRLRLIDGMHLEEHHEFDAGQTRSIFEQAGFRLVRWSSFECGLNNLFVFEKPAA